MLTKHQLIEPLEFSDSLFVSEGVELCQRFSLLHHRREPFYVKRSQKCGSEVLERDLAGHRVREHFVRGALLRCSARRFEGCPLRSAFYVRCDVLRASSDLL